MFHVALKMPCCCLNFGLRKSIGSFLEQRLVVWAERAFRGVQAHFLNRERKNVVHVIQRRKQFFFYLFFPMPGNDRRSRQRRRWRNQWSRIPSYHEKDEFVLKHCHSFTIYVYWCKKCCVKCTEPKAFPYEEKPLYHLGQCHITINKFPYLWWFLNHSFLAAFWQLLVRLVGARLTTSFVWR